MNNKFNNKFNSSTFTSLSSTLEKGVKYWCEIYRCHWHRSGVFIVNLEHFSHLLLVFLNFWLWTNKWWLGNHSWGMFMTRSNVYNGTFCENITAWKLSKCGVISDPYFSCIRTEYGDLLRIHQYRKIRTRNNSVFGHFSRSEAAKNR